MEGTSKTYRSTYNCLSDFLVMMEVQWKPHHPDGRCRMYLNAQDVLTVPPNLK